MADARVRRAGSATADDIPMANARVRRAGGAMADDVLRHVFSRLPGYEDLLRCAATCKRWRRLATDRAFLRRIGLWPETARRQSILAGIFYQNAYPAGKPRARHGSPPKFMNLQAGGAHITFHSCVKGAHLNFGSFVDNDDGLFDLARPLASRRGLLLVSILPPALFDHQGLEARDKLQLAVCRPLIDKQRRLLPLLSFDLNEFLNLRLIGCALLTDEDHIATDDTDQQRRRSTMFQVLLTYTDDNKAIYVYTYSSASDSWSTPTKCCKASHLTRCGPFAGVVTPGTVHWLYKHETRFFTLNVNAITTDISLTMIPIHVEAPPQWGQLLFPCVVEGGTLCFVSIKNHGVLELWSKQGQDEEDSHGHEVSAGGWSRSDLVDLGSEETRNLVFFAERRGALLVEQRGSFFTIDLKSKERTSIDIKGEEMEDFKGKCRFPMYTCTSTWCSGFHDCASNMPVLYEVDCEFDRALFFTPDLPGGKMRTV